MWGIFEAWGFGGRKMLIILKPYFHAAVTVGVVLLAGHEITPAPSDLSHCRTFTTCTASEERQPFLPDEEPVSPPPSPMTSRVTTTATTSAGIALSANAGWRL
jgi:hypothetical protein